MLSIYKRIFYQSLINTRNVSHICFFSKYPNNLKNNNKNNKKYPFSTLVYFFLVITIIDNTVKKIY